MTQDETLKLWEECENARKSALNEGKSKSESHTVASKVWTAWARPLIERRTKLETEGMWSAWPNLAGKLVGQNAETMEFLAAAEAVFSSSDNPQTFPEDAMFTGWIFPGRAEFNFATFDAPANFDGTVFMDVAEFRGTQFKSTTRFEGAMFLADSSFGGGEFASASFHASRFARKANFSERIFENDARFSLARFRSVEFTKDVSFFDAIFEKDGEVSFRQATFADYVTFGRCRFLSRADFQAVKADRAFTLEGAHFDEIPDFVQSHFSEAPRLDNTLFKEVNTHTGDKRDEGLAARFRALKRLAVSGHDTERELEFSAGEIRSRRHREDQPFGKNVTRFWLGWFYEQVSDFGRSAARPARMWLLLIIFFAVFYLSPWSGRNVSTAKVTDCVEVHHIATLQPLRLSTNAIWEALQLSFRNGTAVFGSADTSVDWYALGCLYGPAEDQPNIRRMPRGAAMAATLQRVMSATLIFLFGMALRNMLKMK
jgi:hypothetical protein